MTHLNKVWADHQVSQGKKINPCNITYVKQSNKTLFSKNKEICNAYGCSNIAQLLTTIVAGSNVLNIVVCEKCLPKFSDIPNNEERKMRKSISDTNCKDKEEGLIKNNVYNNIESIRLDKSSNLVIEDQKEF